MPEIIVHSGKSGGVISCQVAAVVTAEVERPSSDPAQKTPGLVRRLGEGKDGGVDLGADRVAVDRAAGRLAASRGRRGSDRG